jgi:hypothetical protein
LASPQTSTHDCIFPSLQPNGTPSVHANFKG